MSARVTRKMAALQAPNNNAKFNSNNSTWIQSNLAFSNKTYSGEVIDGAYASKSSDKYYKAGMQGLYIGKILFQKKYTKGGDNARLTPEEKKKLGYVQSIIYSKQLFWEQQG